MSEPIRQEDLFGKPQIVEEKQRTAEDDSARPDAPPSVPERRSYAELWSPSRGLTGPDDAPDSPLSRDDALAAARALVSRLGAPWVLGEAAARHYRRVPEDMHVYHVHGTSCWVIPVVPEGNRVGFSRAVVVWDDTGTAQAVTFGE